MINITRRNHNSKSEIAKLIKLRHITGDHIRVIKQCHDRGSKLKQNHMPQKNTVSSKQNYEIS